MRFFSFYKLTVFLLYLFSSVFFSQNQDSVYKNLITLLEKVDGNQKVFVLNQISKELIKDSAATSLDYALRAKELAEEVNSTAELAKAFFNSAEAYKKLKQFKEASENYLRSSEIYGEINKIRKQAESQLNAGDAYESLSEFDSALVNYTKSLENFKILNDRSSMGDCLNNIGIVHKYKGEYQTAIDYHIQALKVFEELGEKPGISNSYGNIGNVYEAFQKYDKALENYEKALQISIELDDNWRIGNTIMNIGVIKYYMGNPEQSIEEFKKSVEYFEQSNDKEYLTYALTNIGAVYQELGKNKSAKNYLNRSLKISRELDKKWSVANTLVSIARLNFATSDYDAVRKNTDESIEISKNIGAKDLLIQNYSLLSNYFEEIKDYKRSLEYYKKMKETNDSLFNETRSQQIAELQTKYETEKKENEINELKKEKAEQTLQVESEKNLRNIFVLIAVSISILTIVLYNFYHVKKKLAVSLTERNKEIESLNNKLESKNKKLAESEESLRQTNEVKDKFFSIIAHDLKNPFTAIINYFEALLEDYHDLTDKEKVSFIKEMQKSANTIYTLFENLLNWSSSQTGILEPQKEELNLHNLINDAFSPIRLNAAEKNIIIQNKVDEETKVNADQDMLKTILRNLISNAIKYSFNDTIIYVRHFDESCANKISVEDEGIGISNNDIDKLFRLDVSTKFVGSSELKGSGLGLILCKELVEKQGGKIWVESKLNQGSKFFFTLPKLQVR